MSKLLSVYGHYEAIRNILFKCETHEQLYKTVCSFVTIINEERIEALRSNDLMAVNGWTTLYIWAINLKEEVGTGNYSKIFGITQNTMQRNLINHDPISLQPAWFLSGNIRGDAAWKNLYTKLYDGGFWEQVRTSGGDKLISKLKWNEKLNSLVWLVKYNPKVFMCNPTPKELEMFIRTHFEIDFSSGSLSTTLSRLEKEGASKQIETLRKIMVDFESTIYANVLENSLFEDIVNHFPKTQNE